MDGLIASRPLIGVMGVFVLGAFVVWESMAAYPVVPLALVRTPQLIKTYSLEIVIGVLEGSLFFIPTVLVGAQGLSYSAAGFVAALGAFTFVAVIPMSGRALDRIGSRDVLLAGAILTELGLAIFALAFASLPLVLLAMIVAGAGFGALLGAPTRYVVTNETPESGRATAVGLLSQALIVGQILGSSLAGGLFAAAATETAGYRDAYLAFCGVAFVAMILAATLKSHRDERANRSRRQQRERSSAKARRWPPTWWRINHRRSRIITSSPATARSSKRSRAKRRSRRVDELAALGALAGNAETIALGFDANEHPPELRTHDRFGNRIDEVRFHPSWHRLMQHAARAGLAGAPWVDRSPSPHARRAAKFYVWGQVESGHGCPISMTYASLPVVQTQPEIAIRWTGALCRARVRSAPREGRRKIRRALRHGHDRETRRFGRARQSYARGSGAKPRDPDASIC